MLAVAGPEHVGLGSDFDGIPVLPAGLHSAADLPQITAGLRERGVSGETIAGLLGQNFLRVMEAIETHAER